MNSGSPTSNTPEWQKQTTDRIGENVRNLRGSRTAAWLSDETARLGLRISRSALSELENGKRKTISLGEFLVLAAALSVPPIFLLYPQYPDGKVSVLPALHVKSHEASDWIGGKRILVKTPTSSYLEPIPYQAVELVEEREQLLSEAFKLLDKFDKDPEGIVETIKSRKRTINDQLDRLGHTVDGKGDGDAEG